MRSYSAPSAHTRLLRVSGYTRAVTKPRFVPKSMCRPAEGFGRSASVQWESPARMTAAQRDQLGAAEMQHHIAVAMRRAIESSVGSVAKYATEADVEPARVGRMLRGEIVMRLEDIAAADRHLGEAIRDAGWPGFPLGLMNRGID
jgi:hypothetical protein